MKRNWQKGSKEIGEYNTKRRNAQILNKQTLGNSKCCSCYSRLHCEYLAYLEHWNKEGTTTTGNHITLLKQGYATKIALQWFCEARWKCGVEVLFAKKADVASFEHVSAVNVL